jgi:putative two-component system response regulator
MPNSSDTSPAVQTTPMHMVMTVAALAMATLAETRGSEVGKHGVRVQLFVQAMARHLQTQAPFAALLTAPYIELLAQAAILHDMGTIGIPDRILLKPSGLTPPELNIMKTHTTLAVEAIERIEHALGHPVLELVPLKEMALSHHERWNGSGYPQGLVGKQIPLSARLLAIADVYDALISDRVYKAGIPHSEAVGIIFQGRASQFDPELVDAFIEIEHQFQAIAQQHPNTEQDMQQKIDYMIHAIADPAELPES